jgi:hypothetical protein
MAAPDTAALEAATVAALRKDPLIFFRDVLGATLTPDQIRVVESVRDNRRTASPAGHSVGKSFVAAGLALWFLSTRQDAKVVTTAPTWRQVVEVLWREIARSYGSALVPIGGKLTDTHLELGPNWFAMGLSTDDPTRFQGIHAPHVMVVLDEATGIAAEIWDAAEALAVGPNDRFVAIGNPTDPSSRFKAVCDSGKWNVVEINAEKHPNVLEGRVVVPGGPTREWIAERCEEYGGRDSNLYRARVLGKWPEQGDDALISRLDVEAASEGWVVPTSPIRSTGTDVARFGSDETVLVAIHDAGVVALPRVRQGQDLMATVGMIKGCLAKANAVDDTGMGGGVTDRLNEQSHPVTPVNFGEKAEDEERFVNRRTEIWWNLREAIRSRRLVLPPLQQAPRLHADLTNVCYSMDSAGRIKLEPKDQIKKRLGRSPDHGDALALAAVAFAPSTFAISEKDARLMVEGISEEPEWAMGAL